MRLTIPALVAAVALVAACETAPEDTGAGSGTGSATPTTTTTVDSGSLPGPAAGSVEDFLQVGDRVYFDFDKFNLKPEARSVLEKQAAWLTRYPAVTVVIEGHADERGTREYNLALGERRANSAKDYLVALGVSPNRIRTISYGEERPVALGSSEAAWSQNRRSVTVITGGAVGS